jgi:hypothetical protein
VEPPPPVAEPAQAPVSLPLETAFLHDAADLRAARERARLIHGTDDIDTAGAEVEMTGREVLRRKIPRNFYVGHGHIVDSRLRYSSQLDVIIADDNHTPVLVRALDGTEYMPYESVYAFGEVKSTYYKSKKPIEEFSATIRGVRTNLSRADVPANYVAHGIVLGEGLQYVTPFPRRNPLFAFMIFVDVGDFALSHIRKHYHEMVFSPRSP